jgi:molybdenum cofactor sulfurtransferase
VFVANATAAIKLVGEGLRDYCDAIEGRLRYAYHKDAHNSLVGVREFAGAENTRVFGYDSEVDEWLNTPSSTTTSTDSNDITLFAYPGQSNMTGQRHPLHWLKGAKKLPNTYTLLDAAALATTKQLELSWWAPDFTAVSFYKIFGFPELGALIVRKSAAHLLARKKYFAGGTVDGVTIFGGKPSRIRRESIHEQLEEGTLPFHSIIALDHALETHTRLFGSMDRISAHVAALTRYCAAQLHSLTYPGMSQKLCHIYTPHSLFSHNSSLHGGTIALNLYTCTGQPIGYRSVERLADSKGIFVRSGAMCNPGGMATHLGWSPEELEKVFEAGFRCSKPIEVWEGKWTGVVRVSFGAASCRRDVDRLVEFLRRSYLGGEMTVGV